MRSVRVMGEWGSELVRLSVMGERVRAKLVTDACICVYKIFPNETRVYKTCVLCKFWLNIEFLILDIYEYKKKFS